jgi:hypothetical protein
MKKKSLLIKTNKKRLKYLESKSKIKELKKENKLKDEIIHVLNLNIFLNKNNIIV